MTTLTLSASTLLCDGQYWYSSERIIKIQFVSWPGWHRLIDPSLSSAQRSVVMVMMVYWGKIFVPWSRKIFQPWLRVIMTNGVIASETWTWYQLTVQQSSRWWPVDWCTPGRCQWCTLYTVHCTMHGKSLSWLLQVEVVTCDHSLQSVKVSWKC